MNDVNGLPNCYRCGKQPCECKDGCTIYHGDCREVMPGLESESVQMCVTSPPYWGLRDYGTASWEGGDAECDHKAPNEAGKTNKPSDGQREHAGRFTGLNCHKCGAKRIDQQLGLEETPEAYVAKMVEVFRAVRRVLRDDGTCWINLGDCYASGHADCSYLSPDSPKRPKTRKPGAKGGMKPRGHSGTAPTRSHSGVGQYANTTGFNAQPPGLKPKDLVGIPWRVAFALQTDGWYLRQDIIWHKPNPMPESVTDRCTKAHEYVFLLSKSARYRYDAAAIAEPAEQAGRVRADRIGGNKHGEATTKHSDGALFNGSETRNKRSVWTVATKSYKGAHFATFPPDLIKPCILAGCPEGGVVLDPFLGSGTTAEVARKHGRGCVGIELNAEYLSLAAKRLEQELLFT